MIPQKINEWIDRLIKEVINSREVIDSREVIEAEIVEEHEVKLLSAPKKIDIYV